MNVFNSEYNEKRIKQISAVLVKTVIMHLLRSYMLKFAQSNQLFGPNSLISKTKPLPSVATLPIFSKYL